MKAKTNRFMNEKSLGENLMGISNCGKKKSKDFTSKLHFLF